MVGALGMGMVGYVIGRWWVAMLPPFLLIAGLLAVGTLPGLYERVPEDIQAALFIGLLAMTLTTSVGVLARRSERRPERPMTKP